MGANVTKSRANAEARAKREEDPVNGNAIRSNFATLEQRAAAQAQAHTTREPVLFVVEDNGSQTPVYDPNFNGNGNSIYGNGSEPATYGFTRSSFSGVSNSGFQLQHQDRAAQLESENARLRRQLQMILSTLSEN